MACRCIALHLAGKGGTTRPVRCLAQQHQNARSLGKCQGPGDGVGPGWPFTSALDLCCSQQSPVPVSCVPEQLMPALRVHKPLFAPILHHWPDATPVPRPHLPRCPHLFPLTPAPHPSPLSPPPDQGRRARARGPGGCSQEGQRCWWRRGGQAGGAGGQGGGGEAEGRGPQQVGGSGVCVSLAGGLLVGV